ncbi:Isochorismatase hydrolase [Rickenella mellea]|uniref:Isochorismatase hydrolase n=1 Tax=Rickenella mellea TaxID=50990 RepID=A0A4R5XG77_9AGAM|nr:Isochorismatase hydrolase [Rickenella mellea]
MSVRTLAKIIPGRTAFFMCDMQTRFRSVIHQFDHVVATANKMLKIATILRVPVVVTEQNPLKLGKTLPELAVQPLGALHVGTFEKTLFSMITPQLEELLNSPEHNNVKSIVLFGIESHVCVLQTTLDLLERGYDVHVLADGVSSCNKEEVPWALARMRQAGAQITTSESAAFQLMVDSDHPDFRPFAAAIKEEKENTAKCLDALLGSQVPM